MELAFVEHNEEYGIIGLKKKGFYEKIQELFFNGKLTENLWVAKLSTKQGECAGYFCMFSTDEYEYFLKNDKGSVRVFKTIEAAKKIYNDFVYEDGTCITHVYLGLV